MSSVLRRIPMNLSKQTFRVRKYRGDRQEAGHSIEHHIPLHNITYDIRRSHQAVVRNGVQLDRSCTLRDFKLCNNEERLRGHKFVLKPVSKLQRFFELGRAEPRYF